MELFLDIFIFVGMSISILSNILILLYIHTILKSANKINKTEIANLEDIRILSTHILSVYDLQKEQSEEINRSILALRESLESSKPIKSNNWEGIREAFTRPTRIEVNERN